MLYSAERNTGLVMFYVVRQLTVLLLFTWNIIGIFSSLVAVALFANRISSSCHENEIRTGTVHLAHNEHVQLSNRFGFVHDLCGETSLAEIRCIQKQNVACSRHLFV